MKAAIASERSAPAAGRCPRAAPPGSCTRAIAALAPLLPALALMCALLPPATHAAAAAEDSPTASATAKRRGPRTPTPKPTPIALPDGVKIPVYAPGPLPFHDGERLVYQASWIGIPAARARIELHKNPQDPELWVAEAWIETNRFADIFFKMRDYMKERFAAGSLQTRDCYIRQQERKTLNEYAVTFDRGTRMVTMVKRSRKRVETREYISSNPWGPISGAMMALTQDLAPGRRFEFDTFTGNNRYVFEFNVDERERIRVPLGDFDALRITPAIVYLSNAKLLSQARRTTVWVSADRRHLPLRIEAAAFIGHVRADLVEIDGKTVAAR